MGRLEILLLIDVFFLDIRVNLDVLNLRAEHKWVQFTMDSTFKLVMVIDILYDRVNLVLERLDVQVILPNSVPEGLDNLSHFFLLVT